MMKRKMVRKQIPSVFGLAVHNSPRSKIAGHYDWACHGANRRGQSKAMRDPSSHCLRCLAIWFISDLINAGPDTDRQRSSCPWVPPAVAHKKITTLALYA